MQPAPIVPSTTLPGFKRVAPSTADTSRAQVKKFFPGEEDEPNKAQMDIEQIIAAAERAAMQREQREKANLPPNPAMQASMPSAPREPDSQPPNPHGRRWPAPPLPNKDSSYSLVYQGPPTQNEPQYSPMPPDDQVMKQQYSQDGPAISANLDHANGTVDDLDQSKGSVTPMQVPTKSSRLKPGELYERLNQVGEGTYGKVYKARNAETGQMVALKRIRMEAEKDGFPITSVREIKLLQSMRHDNIIQLMEMMVSQGIATIVFTVTHS